MNIARRQKLQALRRLEQLTREVKIKDISFSAPSPGTYLFLSAQYECSSACYFALGEKGKRAEKVADEAVDALLAFHATGMAIDPYLADQLQLPLAFATGPSVFTTSMVTQHLLTNAWVIQRFLNLKITIEGALGEPGRVRIQ
jgi:RNA 3'-terminal phosphate cyclase (ATP)